MMSSSSILNGNFATAVDQLLHPEYHHHPPAPHHHRVHNDRSNKLPGVGVSTTTTTSTPPAVDILDTPKDYIFYVDVPGLSKSDIQVSVEDENTLVIRSSGKRKREDDDDEDSADHHDHDHDQEEKKEGSSSPSSSSSCKYIRLERKRAWHKFTRKFRLPENSNVSAITAKCENGVLTVTVEKLPPPPKPKTVQVTIS
ncbi:Alpha crystallin/Hsp20 domain [Macleaya cordata]|uniref:Alpha crystallin/Hsp20 domain n=1 Tax=Macleaya cordata TaxID=56857 RepID=A0A200QCU1_MACCD|nr:Alpha crystallin/Hsp20 domain [Macleaya cordata]